MSKVNATSEDARKFLELLDSVPGNYTKLREHLEKQAYPDRIINLTGHDITILDEDNQVVDVLTGRTPHYVCSAALEKRNERIVCGIPVHDRVCTSIYNLPDPVPNTYYVVSSITAYCIPEERDDLLTVSDQVRDAAGRVIGCRSLIRLVR